MDKSKPIFQIQPIGSIQRESDEISIQIDTVYRDALKGLDTFSHVVVYWWADQFDTPAQRAQLVTQLPYAEGREVGVFACRSPLRPNLIMSTVCKILAIDASAGTVSIKDIDAFSNTPVIDLKAYFPIIERVQDAHISEYLVDWPEWLPDEGIGLLEHER